MMKIEYIHASRFGNGAKVAQEFKRQMAERGVAVNIHHVRDARPRKLPPADLYLFSSPGRMGKPKGNMRRFLKKVRLERGVRYAILTTEAAPRPDKKTGRMPTPEEQAKWSAKFQEETKKWVAELEKKGLPAKDAVMMYNQIATGKGVTCEAFPAEWIKK